ncbi:MAG: RHS repeat protein [Planctomycetota bacterium]|nr:RHS repeat protein [Planctomycetota bacterium]
MIGRPQSGKRARRVRLVFAFGGPRRIVYAYDQVGNLLESDDTAAGLGVSEFEYDAMDRLVEKTTVAGVVAYEYDLSGMKTRVTDPNSEATTHAYDEAGRLIRATVLDTPNRENYFHHDRSGLIERKVLADNKVVSYYAYDVAGRLSSLVNRDDAAAVISSFVYQRNPNGAVTRAEHEDGEFTYYAYDALDRLTEERRVQNPTVYGFAYQYDAASNRVRKEDLVSSDVTNYTVDARNLIQSEVTGADEIAYEYDLAQRMKRRASAEEATLFSHNQRDLPTKVEFESETPEATREFKYNGTGERVAIVGELGAGYETRLAYDGTRLLTEKDEFDNTFGRYRWGAPQHGGALVESSNPAEAGPEEGPVMDERGSVDRLVGVSGRVIYDRFGVELAGSLASSTRTRFVSPVFLRLGTSERMSLTPAGIYLGSAGCLAVGPGALLGQILGGGFLAQMAPESVAGQGGLHNQVSIVGTGAPTFREWGQERPGQARPPRDEARFRACAAGKPILHVRRVPISGPALDNRFTNAPFTAGRDQMFRASGWWFTERTPGSFIRVVPGSSIPLGVHALETIMKPADYKRVTLRSDQHYVIPYTLFFIEFPVTSTRACSPLAVESRETWTEGAVITRQIVPFQMRGYEGLKEEIGVPLRRTFQGTSSITPDSQPHHFVAGHGRKGDPLFNEAWIFVDAPAGFLAPETTRWGNYITQNHYILDRSGNVMASMRLAMFQRYDASGNATVLEAQFVSSEGAGSFDLIDTPGKVEAPPDPANAFRTHERYLGAGL